MPVRTLSRCGAALFLAVFFSGCSWLGAGSEARPASSGHSYASERVDLCHTNRASCIYKGSYEPGERAYAEAEAKRLNQASIQRLRRM